MKVASRIGWCHQWWVGFDAGWACLRIAVQHSGMAIPSSLFNRLSVAARRMWIASFRSSVLLCVASSKTLMSSHSIWWWLSRRVQQLLTSLALLSLWPSDVLWCGPRGLSSSLLCTRIHCYMKLGILRWTFFPVDLDLWPASTAHEDWMWNGKSSWSYNVSIPVSCPHSVLLHRGWRLLPEALQLALLLYEACWLHSQMFLGNHCPPGPSWGVLPLWLHSRSGDSPGSVEEAGGHASLHVEEGDGRRNASISLCDLASGIH